jgi:hypothetical protein
MFEDFDHGDDIKTFRGKGKMLTASLHARNRFPELLQMRHMNINPASVLCSPRQFCCVTPIAASEIQDTQAPKVQNLIYFPYALTNGI